MKFELKPYNRNILKEEILEDLRVVARKLGKDSLAQTEYNKDGKYHSSTISHKFGTWAKALEEAGLRVRKYQIIEKEELIEDLKSVANLLKKETVTHAEYNAYGKYSSNAVLKKFKTWFDALKEAGLKKTRTYGVTDEEYFKNLEIIWEKLGRQPKYSEIQKPFSKYSSGAYERRFGSWRKALEAFVKYINSDENTEEVSEKPKKERELATQPIITHRTKRDISWKLRFIIFKRDNFKCKKCGRSPATDPKIILHVDHIKAWANGGETEPENLETLCMKCNIGKSDMK